MTLLQTCASHFRGSPCNTICACTTARRAYRSTVIQQAVGCSCACALPSQLTARCQSPAIRPHQDAARVGVAQQSEGSPRQLLQLAAQTRVRSHGPLHDDWSRFACSQLAPEACLGVTACSRTTIS